MPRGDRTGPMGMGPMTGRGAGYCAGYNAPGYMNAAGGGGFGMGFRHGWRGAGWGGGWRHQGYAAGMPGWGRANYNYPPAWTAPTKEQETQTLKQQAEWLKEQLDSITQRIEEMEQE